MSDIYLSITETPTVVTLTNPLISSNVAQSVTVTNVVSVNVVTMPAINVTAAAPAVTTVAGTVAVSNFPSVTTVAGTVALDANSLSALENVTVTVGAAVSVSNFPSTQTIAGTVTANVSALNIDTGFSGSALFGVSGQDINAVRTVIYSSANSDFGSDAGAPVDSSNPLPVTGTVAVNGSVTASSNLYAFSEDSFQRVGGYPIGSGTTARLSLEVSGPAGVGLPSISGIPAVPVAGTVTANFGGIASGVTIPVRLFAEKEGEASSGQDTLVLCDAAGQLLVNAKSGGASVLGYDGNAFVQVKQVSGSSVTIGSIPAISGTVTASAQNGSLTTRFGTPTTASVAFATSCVTNANRKYLLIQNVTTGSNVITVGIGFTPTTTQGIQLTAGAGITFESSYIPTGAVYVLSSVTASNFTILEA